MWGWGYSKGRNLRAHLLGETGHVSNHMIRLLESGEGSAQKQKASRVRKAGQVCGQVEQVEGDCSFQQGGQAGLADHWTKTRGR